MISSKKEKWETPKLIVLYRGRPEESVLVGCKSDRAEAINGPGSSKAACYTAKGCQTTQCSTIWFS